MPKHATIEDLKTCPFCKAHAFGLVDNSTQAQISHTSDCWFHGQRATIIQLDCAAVVKRWNNRAENKEAK